MANFNEFLPFLKRWEGFGKYTDRPNDAGGPTKNGITWKTWVKFGYDKNGDGIVDAKDVPYISEEDALKIYRREFWDIQKADQIKSQEVAQAIADFGINSGPGRAAMYVQRILGLEDDGIIGPITLKAINTTDAKALFDKLKLARTEYVENLAKIRPSDQENLGGWLNRINALPAPGSKKKF
jgi:lysozyme family protein